MLGRSGKPISPGTSTISKNVVRQPIGGMRKTLLNSLQTVAQGSNHRISRFRILIIAQSTTKLRDYRDQQSPTRLKRLALCHPYATVLAVGGAFSHGLVTQEHHELLDCWERWPVRSFYATQRGFKALCLVRKPNNMRLPASVADILVSWAQILSKLCIAGVSHRMYCWLPLCISMRPGGNSLILTPAPVYTHRKVAP